MHDEFAFWGPGDDGKPWRRNVVDFRDRGTELSSMHAGLFAHIGYGFSVFNLGKTAVPGDVDIAQLMADALPDDCALTTSAQLLQVSRPHIPVYQQGDTVPTLLLVVWGRSPDAADVVESPATIAQRHVEVASDPDGPRMTYEEFAAHTSVKQKIHASSKYRAEVAARLLRTTGIEPVENVYSTDRSQLYSWLDEQTCRIDVHDQTVSLLNDYNTPGQAAICVAHGPDRGVTVYTRMRAEIAPPPSRSVPHNHSLCGAPASDIVDIRLDPHSEPTDCELADAIDGLMSSCEGLHAHVRVARNRDNARLKNYTAHGANYTHVNALSYTGNFPNYKAICCSVVASAFPAPMQSMDDKLYGCIDADLRTLSRHCCEDEMYITVHNNQRWREELIAISPGKAPFHFMNEKTAQIDDSTGEIRCYRVPRTDMLERCTQCAP
jgi:hypothetical protein